jgi:hypothetical protein
MAGRAGMPGRWLGLVALLAGVLFVAGYDLTLAPKRYAYSADSASYIDMAASLHEAGRPLVTPWDVDPGDRDAIPQILFPPGFGIVIAAFMPFAGDAASAALWPSRIAAALLPFLIVTLFRGALSDRTLLAMALLALLTPGVRAWQFVAYSDVTGLAFSVVALGALARGLGLVGRPAGGLGWLLLAGLVAGLGYGVRNSGLAVLGASVAMLGYAWLTGGAGWRAPAAWVAGAAGPVLALWSYNLATFGRLLPYDMPHSTRRWPQNLCDYATSQLEDLGLPASLVEAGPAPVAVAALGALALAGAVGWWRLRAEPRRHGLVLLLGGYVVAGAVLLVISRSRYEWGNFIDTRNTLQLTWALGLGLAVVATRTWPMPVARVAGAGLVVALLLLASDAFREGVDARRNEPGSWLVLAGDSAVMGAARAFAPDTLIGSNAAVLFRISAPRRVRQLEISGEDADFAGSLQLLSRAADSRPAGFLLVCDEWTAHFSACTGRPPATGAPDCTVLRVEPPRVLSCRVPPRPRDAVTRVTSTIGKG